MDLWGRGWSEMRMCKQVRCVASHVDVTVFHAAAKVGGKRRHRQHSTSSTLSRGRRQSLHTNKTTSRSLLAKRWSWWWGASVSVPPFSHRTDKQRLCLLWWLWRAQNKQRAVTVRADTGITIHAVHLLWLLCVCNESNIYWQPRWPFPIPPSDLNCLD